MWLVYKTPPSITVVCDGCDVESPKFDASTMPGETEKDYTKRINPLIDNGLLELGWKKAENENYCPVCQQ